MAREVPVPVGSANAPHHVEAASNRDRSPEPVGEGSVAIYSIQRYLEAV